MLFYKNSILTIFILVAGFLLVPLTTSCSAITPQQSEEKMLEVLRQMTKDGKLPPEDVVLKIEATFPNSRTGALAKLLRARIRFENKDYDGAATILSSNIFREKTSVGDYALWLRGKSLQQAGKQMEAMMVFEDLIKTFPSSLRTREAYLLWANSAAQVGQTAKIPAFLQTLNDKRDADALLLTAKSYEAQGNEAESIKFYRQTYFYGAGTNAAQEAEAKLKLLNQPLDALTAEELTVRADKLYAAKNYAEAVKSYTDLLTNFPNASNPQINLRRLIAFSNLRKPSDAQLAFNLIPMSADEKEQAFYELANAFAKAKQWSEAKQIITDMREKFPKSSWTPKAMVAVGAAAGDARNNADESFLLKSAIAAYPNAVDVAGAQFELAWAEHENNNFPVSSQMLTEHLARYVGEDTTNRGKAGYWAARDSERAGKINEGCALYDATNYRYGANWYGYLALGRLTTMRGQGKCQSIQQFPAGSLIPKAVANLKIITVAPETATLKELDRAENAEELSTVGLFDWAIDELKEAKKTSDNSPKINLALAKHYRLKGDNVNALLSLAKSYPDYAQMFPEEMGREEWDIFYPLTNWKDIKYWSKQRDLDPFQVAGFIRQETIFDPRAKSGANAYGLMQLLIPTARTMARKYNSSTTEIYADTLFQPAINIELGTAYIRDQYNKYVRTEFVAVAYNAGPGRVVQWQKTLPPEMDEFVEEIPFRETKGYVQGIIRNSAQYRRLYDDNGNFKPNVGTKPLRGEIDSISPEQFAKQFPEVFLDKNSE
ncbi:MAG: transglycosylase SLT domain-containing protein [Acidobacteriota bacterium]